MDTFFEAELQLKFKIPIMKKVESISNVYKISLIFKLE
jgi:hypothetical protein